MIDEINSWIQNGCNYSLGVGLYDKYGSNNFFKAVFKRGGETPGNRKRLNELLVELRDQFKPVQVAPVIKTVNVESPVPVTKSPAINQKPKRPALLQVMHLRDQSYKEIRALRQFLETTPDSEELRQIAERLVRTGKKNAEYWERYNYLTEGGKDPEPDEPAPAPPVMIDLKLLEKREQLRKNLNKAENRIKGQDKPKPKTLELIEKHRQALKELDDHIAEIRKGTKP